MTDRLNLLETEIMTSTGQPARLAYDEEGDVLEIVLNDIEATCAVELTDNILLSFNRERGQAVGLTLLDFSVLASPTELGPRNFPLTGLDDLPDDLRRMVTKIITTSPVNQFLKVSSYYPVPTRRVVLTYVEKPAVLAAV